eukprot:3091877-Rhodomonas_salina.5
MYEVRACAFLLLSPPSFALSAAPWAALFLTTYFSSLPASSSFSFPCVLHIQQLFTRGIDGSKVGGEEKSDDALLKDVGFNPSSTHFNNMCQDDHKPPLVELTVFEPVATPEGTIHAVLILYVCWPDTDHAATRHCRSEGCCRRAGHRRDRRCEVHWQVRVFRVGFPGISCSPACAMRSPRLISVVLLAMPGGSRVSAASVGLRRMKITAGLPLFSPPRISKK